LGFGANAILRAYRPCGDSEAFRASYYTEKEDAVKTLGFRREFGPLLPSRY